MKLFVTIREVWSLSTEKEADLPKETERLAWENAGRAPQSAWHVQERSIAPEARWPRGV